MDWYAKYKSPLGYAINDNNTDTYGVDHSGFSTRDEIAYQTARQQRENQMIKNFHNQGITQDYPQAGTNFWGTSPDDNFGFGSSQISSNIENMQNTPVPNVQNQAYGTSAMAGPSSNSSFSNSINSYARIKQLLEQNDYTQNQEVNNTNQLTKNSLPNSGSGVDNQTLTKYKKLIDKHYNEIYKNEGNPNYVYLDPKYIKSIGRGKNIDNVNTFNQVNYKIKGTNDFANEKEKQECYNKFEKWIKQNKKNPDDEHNFKASYFEDFCDLYIDPNEEKRLHNDHVVQDIPIIKNIIKNYDNLSYEKQLAILDMVYNLGTTKFNNQFTNFIKAANANSEKGMLAEYHRKDISESRNKWTADLLKK